MFCTIVSLRREQAPTVTAEDSTAPKPPDLGVALSLAVLFLRTDLFRFLNSHNFLVRALACGPPRPGPRTMLLTLLVVPRRKSKGVSGRSDTTRVAVRAGVEGNSAAGWQQKTTQALRQASFSPQPSGEWLPASPKGSSEERRLFLFYQKRNSALRLTQRAREALHLRLAQSG